MPPPTAQAAQAAHTPQEQPPRVDALLESLVAGAFIPTDPQGAVTKWTDEAIRAFGWSEDEARGLSLFEAPLAAQPDAAAADWFAHLAGEDVPRPAAACQVGLLTRDGARRDAELTIVPIALSQGLEFNVFLGDLALALPAEAKLARLRRDHPAVIEALGAAVSDSPPAAGERLAGLLVAFRAAGDPVPAPELDELAAPLRSEHPPPPPPAPAAEAPASAPPTLENALEHLSRVQAEAGELRARFEAQAQELATARTEAERAHKEAETARGEAEAARAEAEVSQSGAEQAQQLTTERDEALARAQAAEAERAETAAAAQAAEAEAGELRARLRRLESRAAEVLGAEVMGTPEPAMEPGLELRPGFDDAETALAHIAIADGRFIAVNPAFSRLVGYSEADFREVFWPPPADHAGRAELVEAGRQLQAGEIDEAEVDTHYMHAQGLLVPIVGSISLDPAGEHYVLAVEQREAI